MKCTGVWPEFGTEFNGREAGARDTHFAGDDLAAQRGSAANNFGGHFFISGDFQILYHVNQYVTVISKNYVLYNII